MIELQQKLRLSTVSTPFIFYTTVPDLPVQATQLLAEACEAFHQQDAAKTETGFIRAVELAPKSPHLLSNLGAWRCATGKQDDGIRLLHQAMELPTSCAGAWYNMGTLLLGHQLFEQAQRHLAHAITLDDASAALYNNLAVAQFHLKDLAAAEQSCKKALACNDQFDPAYHNLGMIAFEKHQYQMARELFEKVVAMNPQGPAAYNALGCVCALEGDFAHAIPAFQKALSINEEFTLSYHNVGVIALHRDLLAVHAEA